MEDGWMCYTILHLKKNLEQIYLFILEADFMAYANIYQHKSFVVCWQFHQFL